MPGVTGIPLSRQQAIFYDFRIEAGAYDKLSAAFYCAVDLLSCQDCSCTYQNLRKFLNHILNHICRRCGTECNLCAGKTALYECLGKRCRVLRIIQYYYGNNTNFSEFSLKIFHFAIHLLFTCS